MKQTILHQKLKAFLDEKYGPWAWDEKSQCYYDEPYRSYDDIIDDKTIGYILDSNYPMEELEDKCYDWWDDAASQCEFGMAAEDVGESNLKKMSKSLLSILQAQNPTGRKHIQ